MCIDFQTGRITSPEGKDVYFPEHEDLKIKILHIPCYYWIMGNTTCYTHIKHI